MRNIDDNFVDLSNIKKDKRNRYYWKKSIGESILFRYDKIEGECKIIECIDNETVLLNYKNIVFKKTTESIRNGRFGDLLFGTIENDINNPIPYRNAKYAKEGDYIKTINSIICVLKRNTNNIVYECTKCHYSNNKIIGKLAHNGSGCPVCANKIVKIGVNDMWTTNKLLANKLYNPEDGFKYTEGSKQKLDWKCDRCKDKVSGVSVKGTNSLGRVLCPLCSKSVSFPNKFADAVFKQSGIEYEREVTKSEWFNGVRRRYDFLINKTFVELDGGLGHGNSKCYDLTIEEQIQIDKEKNYQAILHGYDIVRINCNYTNDRFKFMKEALFSNEFIKSIIDIKTIDFNEVYKSIEIPLIDSCIEYWNNTNLSPDEIAIELKVHTQTVRHYLNIANKAGKIEYTKKSSWYRSRHIDKKEKEENNYNHGRKEIKIVFKDKSERFFVSLSDMRKELKIQKREYTDWKKNKNHNYQKKEKEKLFKSIETIYENGVIVYNAH